MGKTAQAVVERSDWLRATLLKDQCWDSVFSTNSDLDSGIKRSLSKTEDDSKLGTLPDILEGRPAIQRALDRLK